MFAVGADGICLEIFSIVYNFSFLSSSLWERTRYRLVMRCSLSKFRQKVKIYDTVLILVILFPRRFCGVKHGRTAPVTESVHEK